MKTYTKRYVVLPNFIQPAVYIMYCVKPFKMRDTLTGEALLLWLGENSNTVLSLWYF